MTRSIPTGDGACGPHQLGLTNTAWIVLYHIPTNVNYAVPTSGFVHIVQPHSGETALIATFMGPTWGPSGADRTQVGPMLAP